MSGWWVLMFCIGVATVLVPAELIECVSAAGLVCRTHHTWPQIKVPHSPLVHSAAHRPTGTFMLVLESSMRHMVVAGSQHDDCHMRRLCNCEYHLRLLVSVQAIPVARWVCRTVHVVGRLIDVRVISSVFPNHMYDTFRLIRACIHLSIVVGWLCELPL